MEKYQKSSKINSGGFGVVYKAVRVEDGQVVAYKELAGGASDEDKKRFIREVKIQAKLLHGNVVSILGYDLEANPPWFVMPLATCNLRDNLSSLIGNLPRIADVFQEILDGVEGAHENGVVHRDLKPENILFFDASVEWPSVKIADFGLGKRLDKESIIITSSSENIGTAAYMPPEQFDDFKHVDQRGDIYSLGKILYEMLTGRFPIHVDVKHPNIPGGYGFIISKCLEHEPNERYQSVSELRNDFLLLTNPKHFEKPVQRAEEILNQLLGEGGGDDALLKELDNLFQTQEDDEVLYTKIFPRLPPAVIRQYQEQLKHRFDQRLRRFDQFVNGSLPFTYTDVVADFYREVYKIATEDDVKRLLISRLLEMGCSHNRYYVRDVLVSVLQSIKTEAEALLAKDVLRGNCHAAAWAGEGCPSGTVLSIITETFEWCEKELSARQHRRMGHEIY
jgi:eukaryotic-like serine/threonine-protein kinase